MRPERGTLRTAARVVSIALTLAAGATTLCAPRPALAQPLEEAELETLRKRFFEAIALEEKGDWDAARSIFSEIAAKRTSPQVRYHIALCDENLGRLADAQRGYEEALELAIAEKSEAAAPVIDNAQKRLAPLRPRVPVLTVTRESDDRRAVRLDGKLRMPHELKKPLLLDPGEHTLEVAASGGFELWKRFDLAEGQKLTLSLSEPEAARPVVKAPPVASTSAPPVAEAPTEGGSRVPAVVVGAVGVAALAGGGVMFGLSQVAAADVQAGCPNWETSPCPTNLQARADEGALLHDLSFVVGGVGAAAVVTSVVLWVALGPDDPAQPAQVRVVPFPITTRAASGEARLDGAGALVEARF